MGIDTKGLVQTGCKDVMRISVLAENALNRLIKQEMKSQFPVARLFSEEVRNLYSTVTCHLKPDSEMVQFSFKFRGASRTLNMFFTCDSDYPEYGPKKIHISMGCHGDSAIFIQTVLHALSILGPAHYDANDCDDIGWAPLNAYRPTLLQALSLGYIRCFHVEDWVAFYKESTLFADKSNEALQAFAGIPILQLEEALHISEHTERWDRLSELAKATPAENAPFMEEFHKSGQEVALP